MDVLLARWTCALALGCALWGLAGAAPTQAAPRVYAVQAQASTLKVLLYREGAMSAFAHDHVLLAHEVSGQVQFDAADVAGASLQLTVPVAALEVDPAVERAREGFNSEISASDRAAVRDNMLSASQLAAAAFPAVTVALEQAQGALPDLTLRLKVTVRGREQSLLVPVHVTVTGDTLRAEGQAELRQSQWGIVPYSSFLGAIAVQDRVLVKFSILATASAG